MTIEYVIDTSVLAQGFITDAETARMDTIMYSVTEEESIALHIPEFALIECTNVIWKQVRFHGENPENASQILNDFRNFPMSVHTAIGLLPRALEIGMTHGLAIYDCIHIALAEVLNFPLITVDERQSKVAAAVGITLKSITDFAEYVEPET